jgi:glycosyltransferase involved in cell wall biosynthesis
LPEISILLPFFNRHTLVRETVASVVVQSFRDFELIIVDDGSQPALDRPGLGAGADDPRITIVRQDNGGSSAARNRALGVARGRYTLFLDSDDLLAPRALEVLCEGSRGGRVDAIVGNWTNFSTEEESQPFRPHMPYRDSLANAVEGAWATGSVMLRRTLDPGMSPTWMPWEVAEYYQKAVQDPAASIAHVDHLIVRMRQDTPGRLTNLHGHFDPGRAGQFWRAMKASFPLDDERRSAFDRQLFRFAFSAFHAGQPDVAQDILAAIDTDRLHRYHWYSFLSPAWFVRWGGRRLGLRLQAMAHRARERLRPGG